MTTQPPVAAHYALPTIFYEVMLGPEMVYACPWTDGTQASFAMWIGMALDLRPGQRVLEVGCGWGGLATMLQERFAVQVVGLTICPEQAAHAKPGVEVICTDALAYRESGFDALYTNEMLVHVAPSIQPYERQEDATARQMQARIDFHRWAHQRLKLGGRVVHKDLHLGHPAQVCLRTRAGDFIRDCYDGSGEYVTLAMEQEALQQAGFSIERTDAIPVDVYAKDGDRMMANLSRHQERLEALAAGQVQRKIDLFRTYQHLFARRLMSLDIITARWGNA